MPCPATSCRGDTARQRAQRTRPDGLAPHKRCYALCRNSSSSGGAGQHGRATVVQQGSRAACPEQHPPQLGLVHLSCLQLPTQPIGGVLCSPLAVPRAVAPPWQALRRRRASSSRRGGGLTVELLLLLLLLLGRRRRSAILRSAVLCYGWWQHRRDGLTVCGSLWQHRRQRHPQPAVGAAHLCWQVQSQPG